MESALLLSHAYEPLKVVSWRRAVVLALAEKVEVLEHYNLQVHSPSTTLPLPAVIKLQRKVGVRKVKVKLSRANLFFRDRFTCQYCHHTFPPAQLTFDHVVPRSQGGKTTWTNVVTSCAACNRKKGDKPLSQFHSRLLKPPAEPDWLPHALAGHSLKQPPDLWLNYLMWG